MVENTLAINICFFGLNRSLSYTIDSINRNLLEPLVNLGIDISTFGSFIKVDNPNPRSNEINASPQNNEAELIDFDDLKHLSQKLLIILLTGNKFSDTETSMAKF